MAPLDHRHTASDDPGWEHRAQRYIYAAIALCLITVGLVLLLSQMPPSAPGAPAPHPPAHRAVAVFPSPQSTTSAAQRLPVGAISYSAFPHLLRAARAQNPLLALPHTNVFVRVINGHAHIVALPERGVFLTTGHLVGRP